MIKNIKPKPNHYRQGYYKILNPEKYIGDINNIIYRSSWEKRFMYYCDVNSSVINWSSESIKIPYFNPISNKVCNYYPDFFLKKLDENNKEVFYLIEIKPYHQTIKPNMSKRHSEKLNRLKNYNREMTNYITNLAKWTAADSFAKSNNMRFLLLTENDKPIKINKI